MDVELSSEKLGKLADRGLKPKGWAVIDGGLIFANRRPSGSPH
jgi:hypothetical protein